MRGSGENVALAREKLDEAGFGHALETGPWNGPGCHWPLPNHTVTACSWTPAMRPGAKSKWVVPFPPRRNPRFQTGKERHVCVVSSTVRPFGPVLVGISQARWTLDPVDKGSGDMYTKDRGCTRHDAGRICTRWAAETFDTGQRFGIVAEVVRYPHSGSEIP